MREREGEREGERGKEMRVTLEKDEEKVREPR